MVLELDRVLLRSLIRPIILIWPKLAIDLIKIQQKLLLVCFLYQIISKQLLNKEIKLLIQIQNLPLNLKILLMIINHFLIFQKALKPLFIFRHPPISSIIHEVSLNQTITKLIIWPLITRYPSFPIVRIINQTVFYLVVFVLVHVL